uniref:Zinc finger (CCCH type), RNA-binding motif and serine/arginine rich 2 n=1 Tax=Cyprinus carpio TaxID=7962 RepID=A0A8C2IGY5_CYPCA
NRIHLFNLYFLREKYISQDPQYTIFIEAVQKMLDQAESQLENGIPWKNPDAPKDYGTEKDKANCPFFLKTGACRFGDRCSRKHDHPTSSTTLMVRGMFVVFGMEQSRRDDYDTDASLEYSEEEMHQQFLDFYEDALPEFKNAGRVVQFKVSCNYEPHLRGNVYVQYDTEEKCREAFMMFNGRWYAGRQLQCEFSPVTRWKTAICGLFDRRKCPKGKHCNFLHVFRNPDNEFWEADRDLHMSPDRSGGYSSRHFGSRDGVWSQRSPERISQRRRTDRRSHSRERYSYRGRQSRERRGCSRERRSQSSERRGHSRERRSCSQERRGHSQERRGHSRERRSRSRGRHSRNGEKRSRSRSREKRKSEQSMTRRSMSQREQSRRSRSRSHSRDRLKQGECTSADSRRETSKSNSPKRVSKNRSVKRKSHRMESQSPENSDRMDAHHHKHSKKSKKKKKGKKKHKRKKSKSRSSSSESDKDSRNEECDEKPAKSEERTAVASSTGSPADGVDTTDLEGCHPEEEIHCALTNANKSDGITQSG